MKPINIDRRRRIRDFFIFNRTNVISLFFAVYSYHVQASDVATDPHASALAHELSTASSLTADSSGAHDITTQTQTDQASTGAIASNEDDDEFDAIESLSIVLVLIAVTIIFEKFKHATEHASGRALRPIVDALFGELTVLGFLAGVTYLLQKGGVFDALEHYLEGGDRNAEVFELVENIHFGLFFLMVIFLVSVLIEVYDGLKIQEQWCRWVSSFDFISSIRVYNASYTPIKHCSLCT